MAEADCATATRRQVRSGLVAAASLGVTPAVAALRRPMPQGFLWGAAISAHQSEGNDVDSDSWLLEHLPETVYQEPTGDACDSYQRFAEDFALARTLKPSARHFAQLIRR